MLKFYLIGLLVFTGINGIAQTQTEKTVDWNSDIQYLKKELPLRHKDLFFQMPESEYERKLDYLSSQVSLFNDFEIAVKLQQLIARIGDSHTSVDYTKYIYSEKMLPLRLYWFSDGIYIMQTIKEYENLLGSKITRINDFGIQTVVDSLSTMITVDNQALIKSKIPNMISVLQLLEYFGFAKGNVIKVEVESAQGQLTKSEITASKANPVNIIGVKPDSLAFCWQNPRAIFIDKYFDSEGILYVQYNKCTSKEMEELQGKSSSLPSFLEFGNKVFDIIQNMPVKKFIFDLRFNGGGSSIQGTEFVSKLSGYPISKQDKRIYVVIGRQTFSSAIINAMDFKHRTKAIFVGEETGGKPNHFGEVRNFQLPSSKLIINYSTKYFTESKEDLKSIKPDVIIEPSFSDYKKGLDPVYEWIRKQ